MGPQSVYKEAVETYSCPEAVGLHQAGRDGHCCWCGRKVERPIAYPKLSEQDTRQTQLGLA